MILISVIILSLFELCKTSTLSSMFALLITLEYSSIKLWQLFISSSMSESILSQTCCKHLQFTTVNLHKINNTFLYHDHLQTCRYKIYCHNYFDIYDVTNWYINFHYFSTLEQEFFWIHNVGSYKHRVIGRNLVQWNVNYQYHYQQ